MKKGLLIYVFEPFFVFTAPDVFKVLVHVVLFKVSLVFVLVGALFLPNGVVLVLLSKDPFGDWLEPLEFELVVFIEKGLDLQFRVFASQRLGQIIVFLL